MIFGKAEIIKEDCRSEIYILIYLKEIKII
jgi:hypothetical protein